MKQPVCRWCGTKIEKEDLRFLHLGTDEEPEKLFGFCSPDCRDKYVDKRTRILKVRRDA